jgi:hypothetical protein
MATDMSGVITSLQDQTKVLAKIQQSLSGGAPVPLPNYTVAALPTTAATGALAYAVNGRKPGEGSGAGTGIVVWYNVTGAWFAVTSGAQVTS